MHLERSKLAPVAFALAVSIATLWGCTPAAKSPSSEKAKQVATPAADNERAGAGENALPDSATADAERERNRDSRPVTEVADAETSQTDPTPAEPERLVLLTAAGPLIVHVEIYLDGQPQRAAAEALLDKVLRSAASDESADVTWAALVEDPKFVSGQLGNMPMADAAARYRLARDYDANHDERVQPDELAALLTGDMGGGRASSIEWVADRMAREKWNSPLFVLLDANEDGRLSLEECQIAPVRLRSRDVDDNDAVTIADFRPPDMPQQMTRYRQEARPTRGFALEPYALDSIYYTLCEVFNADYGLEPEQFANGPVLFARLDIDQSGRIEQREIKGLIDAPADMSLRVDFFSDAEPKLTAGRLSDELIAAGAQIEQSPERLILDLPAVQFDLYVSDAANPAERLAEATRRFESLDANGDKSLDAEELAKADLPAEVDLKTVDANGDGKLTLEEVRGTLAADPTYRDLQLRLRLAEEPDPLLGWLDERPDARLTSRELSGAAQRLAQLDANGDGIIAISEIPDRLLCVIQRGGDSMRNNARGLTVPAVRQSPGEDTPAWLSAMDRNGDGEISRREFLGTPEQFARFDANDDGYLESAEATAAAPPAAESIRPQESPAETSPVGGP